MNGLWLSIRGHWQCQVSQGQDASWHPGLSFSADLRQVVCLVTTVLVITKPLTFSLRPSWPHGHSPCPHPRPLGLAVVTASEAARSPQWLSAVYLGPPAVPARRTGIPGSSGESIISSSLSPGALRVTSSPTWQVVRPPSCPWTLTASIPEPTTAEVGEPWGGGIAALRPLHEELAAGAPGATLPVGAECPDSPGPSRGGAEPRAQSTWEPRGATGTAAARPSDEARRRRAPAPAGRGREPRLCCSVVLINSIQTWVLRS